jgi:bacterioferritin-associated ferredoxin
MYICHCNALTDADVRRATEGGACRLREIYAAAGCRAQCGNCTGTMLCLLRSLIGRVEEPLAGAAPSGLAIGAVAGQQ